MLSVLGGLPVYQLASRDCHSDCHSDWHVFRHVAEEVVSGRKILRCEGLWRCYRRGGGGGHVWTVARAAKIRPQIVL